MDVTTTITAERNISTTMFVKPTDSKRYLNGRSFHSPHTFSGIPFSQFRRAAVICSSNVEREMCIERMVDKFLDSGYDRESLQKAKERAIELDREEVLGEV